MAQARNSVSYSHGVGKPRSPPPPREQCRGCGSCSSFVVFESENPCEPCSPYIAAREQDQYRTGIHDALSEACFELVPKAARLGKGSETFHITANISVSQRKGFKTRFKVKSAVQTDRGEGSMPHVFALHRTHFSEKKLGYVATR